MNKDTLSVEDQMIKKFREKFVYKRNGVWHRKVDGYEDENEDFIKQEHEAYAVPDFMEQFLRDMAIQIELEARQEAIQEQQANCEALVATKQLRLKKHLIQEFEEIIGENEAIGLPVTQDQEQDNYNKKQRNKLRAEQRKKLSSLKERKE